MTSKHLDCSPLSDTSVSWFPPLFQAAIFMLPLQDRPDLAIKVRVSQGSIIRTLLCSFFLLSPRQSHSVLWYLLLFSWHLYISRLSFCSELTVHISHWLWNLHSDISKTYGKQSRYRNHNFHSCLILWYNAPQWISLPFFQVHKWEI